MKILWFTNTPCGAAQKLNLNFVRGGWLTSLEQELSKDSKIDLGVCFFHHQTTLPFEYNSVHYFPVKRTSYTKWRRWIDRVFRRVENVKNLESLRQVVESFNPDIIHIHGTESSFGLLQKTIKVPIVISIQGNLTVCSEFFFRGLSRKLALRYSSFKDILLAKSPIVDYRTMKKQAILEQEILSYSKHIIGRTGWDQSISRILAPDSTYYKGDEVLRKSFYEKRWDPLSLEKHVLFTTSGENWFKGIEVIFKTAVLLKKYNFHFKWNIAGVGAHSRIRKVCERLYNVKASDIGLLFLGDLGEESMVNEMSHSSVFVQTSHIENSPNSLCEAMLLGVPVIASFAGGTHSLFQHNEEGILVQDGDAYGLAGEIILLLQNRSKAIQIAENARRVAVKRHDADGVVKKLKATYSEVIQKSK